MRMRLGFVVGAAVGYVLGTRAGSERYEDLKKVASKLTHNPIAASAGAHLEEQAAKIEDAVSDKLGKGKAEQPPADREVPDLGQEAADTEAHAELSHVWTEIGESAASSIAATDQELAEVQNVERR